MSLNIHRIQANLNQPQLAWQSSKHFEPEINQKQVFTLKWAFLKRRYWGLERSPLLSKLKNCKQWLFTKICLRMSFWRKIKTFPSHIISKNFKYSWLDGGFMEIWPLYLFCLDLSFAQLTMNFITQKFDTHDCFNKICNTISFDFYQSFFL